MTNGDEHRDLPRAGHVRSLVTPAISLAYLVARPDAWPVLLAFAVAPFALDLNETRSPPETRQPAPGGAGLDALLYALVAIHWANLVLALDLVADLGLASPRVAVAVLLVALSASLAGAVTGHELIHRRSRAMRWLGRLVLASVLYEHFYTEHLRGHHARVGTADDPTTARRDESFAAFLRRTLPAQLRSAWGLDARAVAVGLAVEAGLIAGCGHWFGAAAVVFAVVNAGIVTVLFQAVSYIEHWGLSRDGAVGGPVSWDTTNRSTLFSMVGPARHADHHAHPSRPFHALRYVPDSPKLPHGYAGMLALAMFRNRRFRRIMTDELRKFQRT